MLRWCRIVANQPTLCTTVSGLQAHSSVSAATSSGRLATAHFLSPGVAQQRLDPCGLVAWSGHEDAEPIVREPRVVLDRARASSGERRVEQDTEDGGERAEQDRHLEHDDDVRSEEHTSELQSLAYLVCRLLLEKKKKI